MYVHHMIEISICMNGKGAHFARLIALHTTTPDSILTTGHMYAATP